MSPQKEARVARVVVQSRDTLVNTVAPKPARKRAPSHLGDAVTVGKWEEYDAAGSKGPLPDDLKAQITANRNAIPSANIPLSAPAQGRPKAESRRRGDTYIPQTFGTTYFDPADARYQTAAAALAANPTPAALADFNDAKRARFMVKTFIDLLPREGGPASINTWDGAILTWGVGFAFNGGALDGLFDKCNSNEKITNFFYNCGFRFVKSLGKTRYQVVDLGAGNVIVDANTAVSHFSKPTQNPDAGRNSDVQLLDMLVLAAKDPDMDLTVAEANFSRFQELHKTIPHLEEIKTQAVHTFVVHLHHFSMLSSDPIGYAVSKGALTLGDTPTVARDMTIAFYAFRNWGRFNSNRFHQVIEYWRAHMLADAIRDGEPLPETVLGDSVKVFYQTGFEAAADIANISADHKKMHGTRVDDGGKAVGNDNAATFDGGPATNFQ